MSYKVPGLTSIILLFAALAIAVYQLFASSILLGLAYTLFIPLGFLCTLYNYCRKCPHVSEKTCRHVVFGWLVNKLFKTRNPSRYSLREILLALTPLAVIVIFPQYWLFKSIGPAIVFWVLALAAVIIVRAGVCTGCRNVNCTFCTNEKNYSSRHG